MQPNVKKAIDTLFDFMLESNCYKIETSDDNDEMMLTVELSVNNN